MMEHAEFERIYRKYYQLAMQVAYHLTGDHEASQDVVQEVFLKMYQNFHTVDAELVRSWIVLNTRRMWIDFYRKERVFRGVDCPNEVLARVESRAGVPETCLNVVAMERLKVKILQSLQMKNPVWYELMIRVVIEGEQPEQVAKDLDLTLVHLRTKIHRARAWIRQEFGIEYDELK